MFFRACAFALVFTLPAPAPAGADDGWVTDKRTGCKVWARNVEPGDEVAWNGACQNGLANGRGTYEFLLDGKSTWKGEAEFRSGKREGHGFAVSADGVRLEGEYHDGVLNGRVIETDAEDGRYVGDYRDGERNGTGRYTYANGDRYDGEFRNGLPNGQGTFRGHNQIGAISLYDGTWRDGCFSDGDRTVAVLRSRAECGFD
jgi:hypothetical protein